MKTIPDGVKCKMRGKKTHALSCGCCVAVNFKWSERLKEAKEEILGYSPRQDNDERLDDDRLGLRRSAVLGA